jgi:hypothetical protein
MNPQPHGVARRRSPRRSGFRRLSRCRERSVAPASSRRVAPRHRGVLSIALAFFLAEILPWRLPHGAADWTAGFWQNCRLIPAV